MLGQSVQNQNPNGFSAQVMGGTGVNGQGGTSSQKLGGANDPRLNASVNAKYKAGMGGTGGATTMGGASPYGSKPTGWTPDKGFVKGGAPTQPHNQSIGRKGKPYKAAPPAPGQPGPAAGAAPGYRPPRMGASPGGTSPGAAGGADGSGGGSYHSGPQGGYEGASPTGGTFRQGSADGVNVQDPNFGSMQKYQDEAYNHAMRSMQPQMDQQNRKFEQTLVNKGIDPNSAAGKLELDKLQRGQNDMKNSAMFNAMQFGQQAQQQAWQQGFGESQLAGQMSRAQMTDATNRYGMDQQNDQFNANLNQRGHEFDSTMANRQSEFGANLGQRQHEFGANMGQRQHEFGQTMGYQNRALNQADRHFGENNKLAYTGMMSNMMNQYAGMDQNIWGQNQAQDYNQFNSRQAVAGAVPGWTPSQVNVAGNAGAATNSQQANFNAGMQQASQPWQTAGQVGGAFAGAAMMSDRRLKDDLTPIGTLGEHTLYRWTWNADAEALGLEGTGFGAVAQELPDEFVIECEDGYLAVNYDKLLDSV